MAKLKPTEAPEVHDTQDEHNFAKIQPTNVEPEPLIKEVKPVVPMVAPNVSRELTWGEKACGVNFNPSNEPKVDRIKAEFAAAIDTLYNLRDAAHDAEVTRMLSVAITEAQTAQMWAVKAITWRY